MLYFIINIYLLVLTRLYCFFLITKSSKKEYIFQINKEVTSVIKENKENNVIKKVNLLLLMFFFHPIAKRKKKNCNNLTRNKDTKITLT